MSKLTQEELADNLKSVYRGEHSLSHDVYVQLWEQIHQKPTVTRKEIEKIITHIVVNHWDRETEFISWLKEIGVVVEK